MILSYSFEVYFLRRKISRGFGSGELFIGSSNGVGSAYNEEGPLIERPFFVIRGRGLSSAFCLLVDS